MVTHVISRSISVLIWSILGFVLAWFMTRSELAQMEWEIPGEPSTYPFVQILRPRLIVIGCFVPAIMALLYAFLDVMDRYIWREWIKSFVMCTGILTLIFILGDLAENMPKLMELDDPIYGAFRFYALQLPMVFNLILPYSLLLGTLWVLSTLSSKSEITGMMQSGRSLLRITRPIIIGSCFIAVLYGIFGFQWAPGATLYRKLLFNSLQMSKPDATVIPIVYKDDKTNRVWRVTVPPHIDAPGKALEGVEVEQLISTPVGRVKHTLFADRAEWDRGTKTWNFHNTITRHNPLDTSSLEAVPVYDDTYQSLVMLPYAETPWQLIAPSMRPDTMGTPALFELIKRGGAEALSTRRAKTEWYVRLARIASCLIMVFIAIPSAISFQRRSPMVGVGLAVLLAGFMLFLYEFFPTMASAGAMPTWLGAWLPNIIYVIIAVELYRIRILQTSWRQFLFSRNCTAK